MRRRGDKAIEGKLPVSQPLKRKRTSQSVTSSANSSTGENNVDLPIPMSSNTHPWQNEDEAVSSDDDDLRDLEFLDLLENDKVKMPQRTSDFTGQAYTDSRKRKSDGSGGSVSKQVRGEQLHAYESVALANQKKVVYYEALTVSRQQSGPPTNSIKDTIAALDQIQEVVGDAQYWKAYGLMMGPEGTTWREGFMQLTPHNRIGWVAQLQ